MHYSRIMPLVGNHRYFTSTAVFLNEVIKLAVSLTRAMYDISRTLPPSTPATVLFEQLYNSVFSGDGWKLAIPATLYTLQNSLQYIAVSNLDAVHFQILYQLKVGYTGLKAWGLAKWFADSYNGSLQCDDAGPSSLLEKVDSSRALNIRGYHCTTPCKRS